MARDASERTFLEEKLFSASSSVGASVQVGTDPTTKTVVRPNFNNTNSKQFAKIGIILGVIIFVGLVSKVFAIRRSFK